MKRLKDTRTGKVLGMLMGFGISESGTRYAIVRQTRALDLIIELDSNFTTNYEVLT